MKKQHDSSSVWNWTWQPRKKNAYQKNYISDLWLAKQGLHGLELFYAGLSSTDLTLLCDQVLGLTLILLAALAGHLYAQVLLLSVYTFIYV